LLMEQDYTCITKTKRSCYWPNKKKSSSQVEKRHSRCFHERYSSTMLTEIAHSQNQK
jgi:hypothetical protein